MLARLVDLPRFLSSSKWCFDHTPYSCPWPPLCPFSHSLPSCFPDLVDWGWGMGVGRERFVEEIYRSDIITRKEPHKLETPIYINSTYFPDNLPWYRNILHSCNHCIHMPSSEVSLFHLTFFIYPFMYWQIKFTFHGYVSLIILYLLSVHTILFLFLD